MSETAEELARQYIADLKLGAYGKEYDAFLAGYIACLKSWKWPTIGTTTSFEDDSDAIE